MHAFFKGQILCGSKSYLRSDQPFHHRVVGKVQIHHYVVRYSAFLEGPAEEFCYVILYTHCCKDNGKVLIIVASQRSLLHDLGGKLVMGKSVAGEDRQFLSTDQGGQSVNGGDTCLDKVPGIFSGYRV